MKVLVAVDFVLNVLKRSEIGETQVLLIDHL